MGASHTMANIPYSLKAFLVLPTVRASERRVLQTRALREAVVQTYLSHQSYAVGSNSSSPLAHPCLTKDNPHRSAPVLCLLICDNSCATQKRRKKKKKIVTCFLVFPVCATNLCHREPNVKCWEQPCERFMCPCLYVEAFSCEVGSAMGIALRHPDWGSERK